MDMFSPFFLSFFFLSLFLTVCKLNYTCNYKNINLTYIHKETMDLFPYKAQELEDGKKETQMCFYSMVVRSSRVVWFFFQLNGFKFLF